MMGVVVYRCESSRYMRSNNSKSKKLKCYGEIRKTYSSIVSVHTGRNLTGPLTPILSMQRRHSWHCGKESRTRQDVKSKRTSEGLPAEGTAEHKKSGLREGKENHEVAKRTTRDW